MLCFWNCGAFEFQELITFVALSCLPPFFLEAALPALLDIFHRLDTDESGCITREEIAHVPLDMLPPKLLETVSVDSMTDLFELLDVDGGGTLTQNEFVEGSCVARSWVVMDVGLCRRNHEI